ncbi:hypothetical protein CPC08DRAFT_633238, partial [Agrocybe pediades]
MAQFPPPPPTQERINSAIAACCDMMDPSSFQEDGCSVCGQLTVLTELSELDDHSLLDVLCVEGVTRKERFSLDDPIQELSGPILANDRGKACVSCLSALKKKTLPLKSLANGLWLGEVPDALKCLTFAERILIARVRHNQCVVRVSSGRVKMVANCIMWALPTVKVYKRLPPSKDELSEVLAFVFLGGSAPTEQDFERSPMLVRRNHVKKALEWLKLNHSDYADLSIAWDNLESYPLSGVPVVVDYRRVDTSLEGNKIATAMSKFDNDMEEGTAEGPCPFTVHGLTGEEYENI